jgi:trk system potassium uptake protein TrkH
MSFRPIFYINGILLLVLAVAMLIPAAVDMSAGHEDWKAFITAIIITTFFGGAMVLVNRQKNFNLTLKQTFLLTTASWIFMTIFAAMPFFFSANGLSYPDAFFEAMSGITTTGATTIVGLDSMPPGILLWRAMLHWIGGIGFIIIALAVLPMLQISGMQLFKVQSSSIEKVMPRASQIALAICLSYLVLTFICTILLYTAGMGGFDAICYGLSAVSTGGFAPSDASAAKFASPIIDIILIVFMIIGSLPFALYVRAVRGDQAALWQDSQVRSFFTIMAVLSVIMILYLFFTGQATFFTAVINSVFMIVSLMSTTGFANADYTTWGHLAIGIAFFATFLGACSGSTAGGVKIFRLQILWMMFVQQLKKLILPHGVSQVRYNGKVVEPNVQASVAGFFFVYIATWLIFSVILQMTGLDFETAFSGAIAALSNVGPGIGSKIGPAGTFADLPASSIWVLSAAMLIGRMEIFTLFVLLMPGFWKR